MVTGWFLEVALGIESHCEYQPVSMAVDQFWELSNNARSPCKRTPPQPLCVFLFHGSHELFELLYYNNPLVLTFNKFCRSCLYKANADMTRLNARQGVREAALQLIGGFASEQGSCDLRCFCGAIGFLLGKFHEISLSVALSTTNDQKNEGFVQGSRSFQDF